MGALLQQQRLESEAHDTAAFGTTRAGVRSCARDEDLDGSSEVQHNTHAVITQPFRHAHSPFHFRRREQER
jgi:hypothetical protein